jgi:hypothetical protein
MNLQIYLQNSPNSRIFHANIRIMCVLQINLQRRVRMNSQIQLSIHKRKDPLSIERLRGSFFNS